MQTRDPWTATKETRVDLAGHADRRAPETSAGMTLGGGWLVALVGLACPLLCVGPLLLVGLASMGLGRALRGAPWPLIAGAVLVVVALGVWGLRARQARDCCVPAPTRTVGDGTTH